MTKKVSILIILAFFVIIDAQLWNNQKKIHTWESNSNQLTGLGTLIASKIDLPQKKPVQQPNSNFKRPDQLISYSPRPYWIQQKTITNTGETIIENLIGGINFDCSTRPTGHWRDSTYCDVFHACVYGQQKKTYSCPYVGEYTYFDDNTHKCEFLRANPSGCPSKMFFH